MTKLCSLSFQKFSVNWAQIQYYYFDRNYLNSMGQVSCCEATLAPTQFMSQNVVLKNLDIQEDPTETPQTKPINLTQRSTESKRLGDSQQGEFIGERPNIRFEVYQRIHSLQPIELECHRRLQNQRGIAKQNKFFRFNRTGVVYEGQWYNGKPHGYGKNYYTNGGYFEGTFFKGLPHGYGRFINPNGDYYQGEVKFGRGNGEGNYYSGDTVIHGEFKDNVLHGSGQQKSNDYCFKGQYEYGSKKEGLLKYSRNIYLGSFENDQFEGKGALITKEGKYTGNFHNGLQHGYGQFIWKDGSKYRGNYNSGLRQGDGQYFNAESKSIFRGIWKKGVLQGQGEYVEARGTVNKVLWNDGRILS